MPIGIGQLIKRRRKELNMTQADLAEKIGLQEADSISSYEREKQNINSSQLAELAKGLDVNVGYFFGEENTCKTPDDEKELMRIYRSLGEKERKVALMQMQCLLNL